MMGPDIAIADENYNSLSATIFRNLETVRQMDCRASVFDHQMRQLTSQILRMSSLKNQCKLHAMSQVFQTELQTSQELDLLSASQEQHPTTEVNQNAAKKQRTQVTTHQKHQWFDDDLNRNQTSQSTIGGDLLAASGASDDDDASSTDISPLTPSARVIDVVREESVDEHLSSKLYCTCNILPSDPETMTTSDLTTHNIDPAKITLIEYLHVRRRFLLEQKIALLREGMELVRSERLRLVQRHMNNLATNNGPAVESAVGSTTGRPQQHKSDTSSSTATVMNLRQRLGSSEQPPHADLGQSETSSIVSDNSGTSHKRSCRKPRRTTSGVSSSASASASSLVSLPVREIPVPSVPETSRDINSSSGPPSQRTTRAEETSAPPSPSLDSNHWLTSDSPNSSSLTFDESSQNENNGSNFCSLREVAAPVGYLDALSSGSCIRPSLLGAAQQLPTPTACSSTTARRTPAVQLVPENKTSSYSQLSSQTVPHVNSLLIAPPPNVESPRTSAVPHSLFIHPPPSLVRSHGGDANPLLAFLPVLGDQIQTNMHVGPGVFGMPFGTLAGPGAPVSLDVSSPPPQYEDKMVHKDSASDGSLYNSRRQQASASTAISYAPQSVVTWDQFAPSTNSNLSVPDTSSEIPPESESAIWSGICPACGRGEEAFDGAGGMVACDCCNDWFHFDCVGYLQVQHGPAGDQQKSKKKSKRKKTNTILPPPTDNITEDKWYCQQCIKSGRISANDLMKMKS